MKKLTRPAALLTLLAATSWPALAAGPGDGGGVAIAVGPRHPAVASVLLGGGSVAPTVHKQSADFGVIATALTRGDDHEAGDAVQGGGKAPRTAAPSTGKR